MKKALELSPEQPHVLNYLGYSWIDQGLHLDEGMKMLKRATELRPDDGAITDSVGWAFYRLGQYDKAVEWLERASEQKGDDATIIEHLGDAYWHVGRKREARFQWERALNQKPDKDRLPVIKDKLANGLSAGQRQADRLREGRRRQAGRLSRRRCRALRCGLAHAKVNLWLNVVGRRADGYHLLDSLVAFVDLADTLEVRPVRPPVARARRAAGGRPRGRGRQSGAEGGAPAGRSRRRGAARGDPARQAHPRGGGPGRRIGRCRRGAARAGRSVARGAAGGGAVRSRGVAGRRRADVPGRPHRAGVGRRRAPAAGAAAAACAILLVNPGTRAADARRLRRAPRSVLGGRAGDAAVAGPAGASWPPLPRAATISATPRSRCARRSPRCWPSCATATARATPP